MYTRYFGLTEKPFAIAPNPRFLYMSELHREALAHLLYGINGDGCIILFTGGVGTGKTTICRRLVEQLPEGTDVAVILNPKLSIDDLLTTICEELKIPVSTDTPTSKNYIDALNVYLLAAHAEGRNTALIIDEAQNLEIEVLEQLRLLTNLETDTHKLLQIVLIGQPELRDMLAVPALSQVNQRITTRYHLEPLSGKDVAAYIQHRITVAGGDPRTLVMPEKVIRLIHKHSHGIPRLINIICDRALLGAYAENKASIDTKIAKKAVQEVVAAHKADTVSAVKIFVTVALLILLFFIPAYVLFYGGGGNLEEQLKRLLPTQKSAEQQVPAPPVTD